MTVKYVLNHLTVKHYLADFPVFGGPAERREKMKTKLGISAGFIGALAFVLAFASIWDWPIFIALLLVVGYVFINEQNDWLKATVIKALVLVLIYYVAYGVVYLIPTLLNAIEYLLNTFSVNFRYKSNINDFFYFIRELVKLAVMVLSLILAFMAPKFKTIKIGFIDKMAAKAVLPKENAQQ